ncbi:alpha/beta hydrolase [Zhouia sp. PK063]|uniref:alpha/beta hydrolase n=1 Tax=Zhouia sp. PK063 TaxID=3373602 RepID=UPI00378A87FD
MSKNTDNKGYRKELKVPKNIIRTAKTLEKVSPKLAAKFAGKLFRTPLKHKMPEREKHMDKNSVQKTILIPQIQKEVVVYEYGKSAKSILLVHGWSGRGTQLVKIADACLEAGYKTISFDAPAHGKAPGKSTHMADFIEVILHLNTLYSPFEFAIGHSLGSMALLNAVKKGVTLKKIVIIGSGDFVDDIGLDFTTKLQLNNTIYDKMKIQFNDLVGFDINSLSASIAAKSIQIPVLVIHDENDEDVPVTSAKNIHENLKNSDLLITKGLGHRKILGDATVIKSLLNFISK